jgi:hypothetical protein
MRGLLLKSVLTRRMSGYTDRCGTLEVQVRFLRFCQLFVWCEELTHLHRLSGLPSVLDSHTIASIADATAANLTPLVQHSLDQLDHVASQGFTLGQKQPHTQHRASQLFRA